MTSREKEVLQLAAGGLSNREIGLLLNISAETVKTHMGSVLSALSAKNRAHAVALGLREGTIK